MSNKKETGRPLDAENLTDTQMQEVSGGKELDTPDQPGEKKVRFNSANINVSDGDIPGNKKVRFNSANINVSDRD
jgi:hypothetical protein